MITKKCEFCGDIFNVFPYRKEAKYCSGKCFGKAIRKRKYIDNNTCIICNNPIKGFRKYCSKKCLYIGQIKGITKREKTYLKCKLCFKTFYSGSLKSKFCSRKCYYKWNKGENHGSWEGGISKWYDRIKQTKEWKDWREAVFKRDNYICQHCRYKRGIGLKTKYLHPHHIKSATKFKNLIFDISNGLTVCHSCHGKIHSRNFKK